MIILHGKLHYSEMIKIDAKTLRFEHTQMKNNAHFIPVVEMLNHREREIQENETQHKRGMSLKVVDLPPSGSEMNKTNMIILNTSERGE